MTTDSKLLAASAGLRAALGHYGLVAGIGRGGMTSVFLALLPQGNGTSRPIVLKGLRSEFSSQNEFRRILENEASLGRRFQHENVVETYDLYADRALCVLTMEFLDGQTLSSVRECSRQGSETPLAIQMRVLADTLAGLHYVHELKEAGKPLGIVHRNVAPSNVFVTYEGRVKLVDFAIARATLRDAETRMSGVVKGNIGYMSPEAVRRENLDRRTDIFSVGVMLWEAATGRRLWQGHDEIAIFRRLSAGDLPNQTPSESGTRGEMLRVAARALAVDPRRRYATAEEMRLELEDLLGRAGHAAPTASIAEYTQTLFAVDREKFRAVVDEARSALTPSPVGAEGRLFRTDAIGSSASGAPSAATRTSPLASTGSFRTTSTSYDVVERASGVFDLRRRIERAAGIVGVIAAAAVGIAYAARAPSRAPAQSGRSIEAATAPTAAPEPPAPAPPRGTISAVFLVRPAHARLFLDGAPLEGNPAGIRRTPDEKPHLLRIEAAGYTTVIRAIDLDRDVAKEFELAPEPPPAASAPPVAPADLREDPSKPRTVKPAAVREDPWGI
jgi:serine/threonine protein kinase